MLSTLLAVGLAAAARPPDLDRSRRLVDAIAQASAAGTVSAEQVADWIAPPNLSAAPEPRRAAS